MTIECRCGDVPGMARLLSRHPKVVLRPPSSGAVLSFRLGTREREIRGGFGPGLFGLVELVDNNPLVCADAFRVPDPASTAAAVALGPLVRAGLLAEAPVAVFSRVDSPREVELTLASMGWDGGVVVEQPEDAGRVLAATVMAEIEGADDLGEIDELYDEAYGRSFLVRRDEVSDWSPELVDGAVHAIYRLAVTPGDGRSLLTIRVMSDLEGKCGAAQYVHAMNVMCGFEETLGF